jgi:type I restriction enzyme S subunit
MNKSWNTEVLTDVANFYNGLAFKPSDWAKEGVPIIRIEQITRPDTTNCDFYRGDFPSINEINYGDVIFSWSATLKVIVWKGNRAVLNQHLFKVEGKGGNDKYFIAYLLDHIMEKLANASQGSTMKHVTRKALSTFEVKIPKPSQQRKIARILSTCDAVIEKTEAAIAKYRALRQGLMHDLFTRGIDLSTGRLRPSYEEAPELYKHTELGWVPKEWEVKRLGDLTHQINDGTHFTPQYTEYGVPFLRVTDVQTDEIDIERLKYISRQEHEILIKRCNPQKGDILYSKNGTIGIPKIVDWDWEFSIFVSLALIKPMHRLISTEYLASLLPEEVIWSQIRSRAKQGTVTNLHLEEIREFTIPLPTADEQEKISAAAYKINRKLEMEELHLSKYRQLKAGLMQDLLTPPAAGQDGKVEVSVEEETNLL